MKMRRTLAVVAAISAAGLALVGCSDPNAAAPAGSGSEGSATDAITIGSANFPESEIIGNLFSQVLQDAGVEVDEKFNIGNREAYIPAVKDGSADLVPDYTGNLLLYLDPEADISPTADITGELTKKLESEGLQLVSVSQAEDTDTVTVTQELAEKWNLKTIADLAAHNDELILGGMPEFNERARGIPGLTELYGVKPAEFVAISDGGGPATVQALLDGTVHGANIYTTAPAIFDEDLVVLEDPEGNFPQQFVGAVMNQDKVTPEIEAALKQVTDTLTTDDLITLNSWVSGDEKMEPQAAAQKWLKEKGLIG